MRELVLAVAIAADAAGATIEETDTADGALEPIHDRHHRTWDELAADAAFPEDGTSIASAHVETAAGAFDCDEYVVRRTIDKAETVTTLDVAAAMPGPPVRMREIAGGANQLTMELLAFGGVGGAP